MVFAYACPAIVLQHRESCSVLRNTYEGVLEETYEVATWLMTDLRTHGRER